MTNQTSSGTPTYNNLSMLVRFLLVLVVSAFSAFGFTGISSREDQLPGMSVFINFAGSAGIGLMSGYFTRVLLSDRRAFLRLMVNLSGILTGLCVLGLLTNWNYGIGPLYFFRSSVDWLGIELLSLACISSVFASLAYHQPFRTAFRSSGDSEPSMIHSSSRRLQDANPAIRPATRRTTRVTRKAPGQTRKHSTTKKKKTGKTVRTLPAPKPNKSVGSPVIRKRSSKKIVLAPVEDHRCPYCLEQVKRNDPRGVVECDICHTLHHADCWAITGTCQVPHFNH